MISQYGTLCAPWDAIPDTPWYAGSCNESAGKDYCTNADSWCDDSWCYVSEDCPTWTASSVFSDNGYDLGFSYQARGAKDCYTDADATGCPDDPHGYCGDPCACKYGAGGLPEAFWMGGDHENLSFISQHGAVRSAWDSLPGTPWHAGSCDTSAGKDYCTKSDSWCAAPW